MVIEASSWRVCVAPMLDWTDRHCRYFHRRLTARARLYTEMVTTGALLHGDVARHLEFDPSEHPVALQLGGCDPAELAQCARLGERWGYDEINLNCGCPSERVQRGAFGACLMAEPRLVADGIKAMRDAVALPVTVKHRIGIDRVEDYGFMRDFVGALAEAGCSAFIVHARNAWLKGLSPKENREIPPLRYELVYQLKRELPHLTIVLNGGLTDPVAVDDALTRVDGVMIGREAYHNPWWLAQVDSRWYGAPGTVGTEGVEGAEGAEGAEGSATRRDVALRLRDYAAAQRERGVPLRAIARHLLGLYQGRPGARAWRRLLSDARELERAGPELIERALEFVEPVARAA